MIKVKGLPNIGGVLALKLNGIGVETLTQLRLMGSEDAIVKIETVEPGETCIHMLYALEGAI